jgi:cell division protein FtsX
MYIRMPFIAEGILAGVAGAGLAIGVLALAERQIVPKLAQTLAFVTFKVNAGTLCLELLAVGAAVGLVASWFSVGRHLRA